MAVLTPEAAKLLWDAAVSNNKKLNDCPKHRFTGELPPINERFQFKMKCERCGGAMQLLHINQYMRGYIAAGGNPEDVWPGWNS